MARFIKGITAGAVIGAVAGMMFMPELDRRTKRKLKRSARYMRGFAEDACNSMRGILR